MFPMNKKMHFCCHYIVCFAVISVPLMAQTNNDTLRVHFNSDQIHIDNLTLERVESLIPGVRPNNFIRSYSPFDEMTVSLTDPRLSPLFREDLSYRFDTTEKVLSLHQRYEQNEITAEPIVGLTSVYDKSGMETWTKSVGAKLFGHLGSSFTFYTKIVDNGVRGNMLDTKRELDNSDGFALSANNGIGGFDFDAVEGQLGFSSGAIQLFIEKIRNVWGYGEDGQIIFSRKAPSYPQFRLVVSLSDRLKFTYIQSILFSDVIDSAQSYGNTAYYDTYRRVYRSKFMAAHLLEYSPSDEWNFSLGESIIYSDAFEPAFLIPVLLFKAVEYQYRDNDNAQIFGGIRYSIPSFGSLYTDFFIDDVNTDKLFSAQNDNVLAGTFGVRMTDCMVNNLDIVAEYTRLNPWVYTHKYESATYTSNSYVLGDWIGQNSELFYVSAEYRWTRSLWLKFSFQHLEKGILDSVHVHFTYPGVPTFLQGPVFHQTIFKFETRWEVCRNLFFKGDVSLTNQNSGQIALTNLSTDIPINYPALSNKLSLNVGITYNLFNND